MEDLKAIWNKINDLQIEVGNMIEMDKVETIYDKLKKEEALRKKYKPWLIPYVLVVMSFIAWISNAFSEQSGLIPIIAIVLITFGALLMMYLLMMVQIPLDAYEHDRTSWNFLKIVKEKLIKRKKFGIIGVALYIITLTLGLHLLIFGIGSLAEKTGEIYLLYGVMFGLLGASIGGMFTTYNRQYKDIINKIDRFLIE